MEAKQRVRNSAKAIVFDTTRQNVLFIEHRDAAGTYFGFPGGGQEHGESLIEAVMRECVEEIGTEVEVEGLCTIRDYIARNHEFAVDGLNVHQVEFYFTCTLDDPSKAKVGAVPDTKQTGIRWISLADAEEARIYPKALRHLLTEVAKGRPIVSYLGDVN